MYVGAGHAVMEASSEMPYVAHGTRGSVPTAGVGDAIVFNRASTGESAPRTFLVEIMLAVFPAPARGRA